MSIIQYPHILTATIPGTTVQGSDGNWVTTDPVTRTEKCRAEPNSSGRYIVGIDGVKIDYAWIVYMPQGVVLIPTGTAVSIVWNSSEIAKGEAKRFSNGQLNTRLWL